MKKMISLLLSVVMICSVFYALPVSTLAKEVDVLQSVASKPVITVESSNLTPYEDSYGEIILRVRGASNVSYQWQAGSMDTGNMIALEDNYAYQGTKTNHFKITATNNLDQYDYRCKITYDGGVVYSRVFRFTFLDVSSLSDVSVSGLSHPYFTQTPDYSVVSSQPDYYSVSKVEWYGPQVGVTGPLMNSTDVFLPGGYYCRIYLKPDAGYKFDDNPQLNVSVDTKTSNYTITVNIKSDESGNYYGDVYFIVEQDSDITPDILDFEWKIPSDVSPNVNLGNVFLGTDTMDISFAFKIKELPRNMALADYTVYGSTYIQCDGESLYYTHTGDRVNLKDVATIPGRYYIYHELFLLDPAGNEIATESVCYFVNVYHTLIIKDVAVEVTEPTEGLNAEIAIIEKTPGFTVNNMYWYDVTDGKRIELSESDVFQKGHTYQAEVLVKANEGCFFMTDLEGMLSINATVNGKVAEVLDDYSDKSARFTLNFTIPKDDFMLGDANCDTEVNIKDATVIQKHVAMLESLTETGLILADVDESDDVNIKDATAIQKHIAGIETGYLIGELIA